MNSTKLEHLRYPVGKFEQPAQITKAILDGYINTIAGITLLTLLS
nr:hypothetical protein [Pedobacter panaciterrae]